MRAFALAAVAVMIVGPVSAEEIALPDHDVDAACAPYKAKDIIARCVRDEQAAYDVTRYRWQKLTADRRLESVKFSAQYGNGPAFYRALSDFMWSQAQLQQMEEDRRSPPPTFRR